MLKVAYFKQHRDYTCGPACLRMVLGYYGIQQDEVTLTMMCGTDISGTALEDIAAVARQFNLSAKRTRLADMGELRDWIGRGVPVITHVDATKLYRMPDPAPSGHLVVVIEANTHIMIHDPERGATRVIDHSDFEASWNVYRKGAILIWR